MTSGIRGGATKHVCFAIAYGLTVLGAIALFLIIRTAGESMPGYAAGAGMPSAPHQAAAAAKSDVLLHVLLAMFAIVFMSRVMTSLFGRLGQPPVVGEVLAGIILGPSLLGRLAPGLSAHLLPAEIAPFLGLIAQLGVILYMFMVGLELDTASLVGRGPAAVAISHASIGVPFLFGAGLSLGLYTRLSTEGVPFTVFLLFLGV
jgi:hypothetical protein